MAASTPLGALIERVKNANHWSDQEICDNAGRHGHKLVKQTLSDMRRDRMAFISPRTIRGLADGLGVSVNEVVRAALAQLGLAAYRPDDWSAEEAVRADASLSADTKRALLAIIAAARFAEGEPDPAAPAAQAAPAAPAHYETGMAARTESRERRRGAAPEGPAAS